MKIVSMRVVVKTASEKDHDELVATLTDMGIDFIDADSMVEFPIKKRRDRLDKCDAAWKLGKVVGLLCKPEVELLQVESS